MTLVLDNGAYTIKLGLAESEPQVYYNCIGRIKKEVIVAPRSINGVNEVMRPHERGVLVDPGLQSKIFKKVLKGYVCSDLDLVISCPVYTPFTCRKQLDEIVFEEYEFKSEIRVPSGYQSTGIIVDLGFSASTVMPYLDGFPINSAITRVNVGGKLLTNYLKEQISFRQYDMRDETWLVNLVKEKLCSVSSNFMNELKMLQKNKSLERHYVLPEFGDDGHELQPEESKEGKQVLTMGNLSIAVPEVLFRPSDIGLTDAGIGEAIWMAMQAVPSVYWEDLTNILLVGGSANFPNIENRFKDELRAISNDGLTFNFIKPENPSFWNWKSLSKVSEVRKGVTKEEYFEMGSEYIDWKFQYS
ncbi:unnamed protein product [Blepharisma stoltei]|uniref:Actin-related protein 6 n=1 Tax=Blepharisma stoltei TaxID=1481888 RepID=A0AAU9JDI5_9CILI|nr:unnamed protein product [Blepharisma stoltei]